MWRTVSPRDTRRTAKPMSARPTSHRRIAPSTRSPTVVSVLSTSCGMPATFMVVSSRVCESVEARHAGARRGRVLPRRRAGPAHESRGSSASLGRRGAAREWRGPGAAVRAGQISDPRALARAGAPAREGAVDLLGLQPLSRLVAGRFVVGAGTERRIDVEIADERERAEAELDEALRAEIGLDEPPRPDGIDADAVEPGRERGSASRIPRPLDVLRRDVDRELNGLANREQRVETALELRGRDRAVR